VFDEPPLGELAVESFGALVPAGDPFTGLKQVDYRFSDDE
jgi:hypothetical protein